MDELKISSKFMRAIVSKLLSVSIRKKFGYKVNVQINELSIIFNDGGKAYIHINADADMNSDELKKITKIVGIDGES